MVNTSAELRAKVINWLNSKNEDFKEGLDLLQLSGYKPNVAALILRSGETSFTKSKLRNELSGYLRYFRNPDSPKHEDIGSADINLETVENEYERIRKEESKEYPDIVKRALYEFNELYVQRSKMHRDLKAVGESNDSGSVNQRKALKAGMEAISRRMDVLFNATDRYKKENIIPGEELFATPVNESSMVQENKGTFVPFELPATISELNVLKRNVQSKLTRHNNKLKFQSVKKLDKTNPMPEGPERIKTEKYIEFLKSEVERINLRIAEIS